MIRDSAVAVPSTGRSARIGRRGEVYVCTQFIIVARRVSAIRPFTGSQIAWDSSVARLRHEVGSTPPAAATHVMSSVTFAREPQPAGGGYVRRLSVSLRSAGLRVRVAALLPRIVCALALAALTVFSMRLIESLDDYSAVPFSLIVLLALVTTALCGFRASVVATILGGLGTILYVVPPHGSFAISDQSQWFKATASCLIAVIVGALYEQLARQSRRSRELALRLQDANQAKDEFIGHVSHDLRTPLTVMLGNANILLRERDRLDAVSQAETLEDIVASGERLQRMVENLLALARPGAAAEPSEPIIVRHVVKALVDGYRRQHPDRQINLRCLAEPTPVICAWEAVEEVVDNLISNADKYSGPDQPIDIGLRIASGALEISVADRGLGFGGSDVSALFQPFVRSQEARAIAPGLGIGLTLARRLVEAHGGRIWAENREGGGAVVSFSLPVQVVEPEPVDDPEAVGAISGL
jgi:K+-sensing histidine kinase KdpD